MNDPAVAKALSYTRVELCVLGLHEGELHVLLAQRKELPARDAWALPGGQVQVDGDPTLDAAVIRVCRERLRTPVPGLKQHATIGGQKRDDRATWTLSVVYRAVLNPLFIEPQPGKRTAEIQWYPADDVSQLRMAFDHGAIIASAAKSLRDEVADLQIPWHLLGSSFTLGQLQQLCEQILGRPLDKSSFRRKVKQRDLVEPAKGMLTGAFRPAKLYKAKSS